MSCILKMRGFYCKPIIPHQNCKTNLQLENKPQTFQVKIHICLPFFFCNLIELIYYYCISSVFPVRVQCIYNRSVDLLTYTCCQFTFNILAFWLCIKIIIFCYIYTEIFVGEIWSLECALKYSKEREKNGCLDETGLANVANFWSWMMCAWGFIILSCVIMFMIIIFYNEKKLRT